MVVLNDGNVWVSQTLYRRPERWNEDGVPEFDFHIDGITVSEELARALALECAQEPVRWFRLINQYGGVAGFHVNQGREAHTIGNRHLHWVGQRPVRVEPIR